MSEHDSASNQDRTEPLVRDFLSGHDVSCPVCNYNLRDNASARCPECGASLELRLASSDLRVGPWLLALLGVALPLGFVAPFLAISIVIEFMVGVSGPRHAIGIFALATAAYGGATYALISRRRRFWRRSRSEQAWLAAGIASAGAVSLAGVIAMMFHL